MAKDLQARLQDGSSPARQAQPPALIDQVGLMEEQFQKAMPAGYSASQLVRDAQTAIRETPRLADCDQASALGAFMTCAQLGLRPNVLGQAYVVPYYDKRQRGYRAQLQVGYQGFIDLAYRSGKVTLIEARTVYEKDDFYVEYGIAPKLQHRPYLEGNPGQAVAYYGVARMTSGDYVFHVMSRFQAEQWRDKHASARNRDGEVVGPWREHFDAMAMKTQIRQLSKWMPKDVSFATAVAADGGVREDLHVEAVARRVEPVTEQPVDVPATAEQGAVEA